jgi:DNA topoisomerase-1
MAVWCVVVHTAVRGTRIALAPWHHAHSEHAMPAAARRRTTTRSSTTSVAAPPSAPTSTPSVTPDPAALDHAEQAGLRWVTDTRPGITRVTQGDGFRFVKPDGSAVTDETTLARIRKLAIPPAYTDVWICPIANGHIQATGRDARGRKQYRYHERWRAVRDETKFERLLALAGALPRLRARLAQDLARTGLARERVLATVVSLMEQTAIRVGNDEYARTNKSYGLTTLRNRHVDVRGDTLRFEFRAKSGKTHTATVSDRRLARIVRQCQALPGAELFAYVDDDGERRTIDSSDVNDYLREISGEDFTAKDLRTWAGTVQAARALRDLGAADDPKEAERRIVQAIDRVAAALNNTRAVCRKYYVHPRVLEQYLAGELLAVGGRSRSATGLSAEERAVVKMLTVVKRAKRGGRRAA